MSTLPNTTTTLHLNFWKYSTVFPSTLKLVSTSLQLSLGRWGSKALLRRRKKPRRNIGRQSGRAKKQPMESWMTKAKILWIWKWEMFLLTNPSELKYLIFRSWPLPITPSTNFTWLARYHQDIWAISLLKNLEPDWEMKLQEQKGTFIGIILSTSKLQGKISSLIHIHTILNYFLRTTQILKLYWGWLEKVFLTRIFSSPLQLRIFNFQVQCWEKPIQDQLPCSPSYPNSAIWALMMHTRPQFLAKQSKRRYRMQEGSTYFCLIEVDLWEWVGWRRQRMLWSFS